jgi:hypothetical protein
LWHGKEILADTHTVGSRHTDLSMLPSAQRSSSVTGGNSNNGLQLKHLQILLRLLQLIHLMADLISDWDCIVDCLEQFNFLYISSTQNNSAVSSAYLPNSPNYNAGGGGNVLTGMLVAAATTATTAASNVLSVSNPYSTGANTSSLKGSFSPMGGANSPFFSSDMSKIIAIIERFRYFTRFLSSEALIKLMTSLVALSMNNVAVHSTMMYGDDGLNGGISGGGGGSAIVSYKEEVFPFDISDIKRQSPVSNKSNNSGNNTKNMNSSAADASRTASTTANNPNTRLSYLQRGLKHGCVNFSLKAVVEISKVNAYRISSIWQMVTSHLRMMAALKVSPNFCPDTTFCVCFG